MQLFIQEKTEDGAGKGPQEDRLYCLVVRQETETCILDVCGTTIYIDITCWVISDGGGGGGGSDDGDDNALRFSLNCDYSVTRGSRAGCTVSVSGEDEQGEPYSAAEFQYDWTSNWGVSYTGNGNGGNEWSGTATEPATITVSVASESYTEMATINVTARSVGSLPSLNAGTAWYTRQPRTLGEGTYGFYRIPDWPPGSVSKSAGSGPWDGQYMTEVTIESSFYSELHVSHDYTADGPDWPLANATCANSRSLPSSSSYLVVNTFCNTAPAWATSGAEVEAHEWEHEASFNSCLGSQSARTMLADIESATGDESSVDQDIADIWTIWWENTWRYSGFAQGSGSGSPFYFYEGGGWSHVLAYPGFDSDGGRRGC